MSDDDAIMRKFEMRAMTPNSGYSVKQSEETMRSLEKENFNLKLKIYFLENKYGIYTNLPDEASNLCNKEYIDLFLENESLKTELDEKREIMTNALQVIEFLEQQKDFQIKESETKIDSQSKRIEYLKVRSKMCMKRMSKKQAKTAPETQNLQKMQEELRKYQIQNDDLLANTEKLKKENANQASYATQLSSENFSLLQKLDESRKNLVKKDNIITSMRQKLNESSTEYEVTKLLDENKRLKLNVYELSLKCDKLQHECKDYQRIVREQSEIMKAFNRTIEAKNDELDDYKAKIEFGDMTNFIQHKDIKLDDNDTSNGKYPFHNPLFGSFHSLYR